MRSVVRSAAAGIRQLAGCESVTKNCPSRPPYHCRTVGDRGLLPDIGERENLPRPATGACPGIAEQHSRGLPIECPFSGSGPPIAFGNSQNPKT
jgi:hypothetical protein